MSTIQKIPQSQQPLSQRSYSLSKKQSTLPPSYQTIQNSVPSLHKNVVSQGNFSTTLNQSQVPIISSQKTQSAFGSRRGSYNNVNHNSKKIIPNSQLYMSGKTKPVKALAGNNKSMRNANISGNYLHQEDEEQKSIDPSIDTESEIISQQIKPRLLSPQRSSQRGVRVCCRIKPSNYNNCERKSTQNLLRMEDFGIEEVDPVQGSIQIKKDRFDRQKFFFDSIYDRANASQVQVYDDFAQKTIQEFVKDGVNGALFAYGQTGSGKTYTMFGENVYSDEKKGVISRGVEEIFETVEQLSKDSEYTYSIKMQLFQIYMENIMDMIPHQGLSQSTLLQIREDPFYGVVFSDSNSPQLITVTSSQNALKIIEMACSNRIISATKMNDQSSRSHSILLMICEKTKRIENSDKKQVFLSKLYFVDLAGSERVKRSKVEGQNMAETNSINLSLTTLGKCIRAMGTENKQSLQSSQITNDGTVKFLPFRDSKLTHALKEAFAVNVNLNILVNISDEPQSSSETMSSLQFATNCKKITNKIFLQNVSNQVWIKKSIEPQQQINSYESVLIQNELQSEISSKSTTISQLQKELDHKNEIIKNKSKKIDELSETVKTLQVSNEQELQVNKDNYEKQMIKLYQVQNDKVEQINKQNVIKMQDLNQELQSQITLITATYEQQVTQLKSQIQYLNEQLVLEQQQILSPKQYNSVNQTVNDQENIEERRQLEEQVKELKQQLQKERDLQAMTQREINFMKFEMKLKENEVQVLKNGNIPVNKPSPSPLMKEDTPKRQDYDQYRNIYDTQQKQPEESQTYINFFQVSQDSLDNQFPKGDQYSRDSLADNDDDLRRDSQLVIFKSCSLKNIIDQTQCKSLLESHTNLQDRNKQISFGVDTSLMQILDQHQEKHPIEHRYKFNTDNFKGKLYQIMNESDDNQENGELQDDSLMTQYQQKMKTQKFSMLKGFNEEEDDMCLTETLRNSQKMNEKSFDNEKREAFSFAQVNECQEMKQNKENSERMEKENKKVNKFHRKLSCQQTQLMMHQKEFLQKQKGNVSTKNMPNYINPFKQ